MGDNDHHESNVVNLHRRDELDTVGREQIASTIFADEDEIYTFSQGNLVPPAPAPPPTAPHTPPDPPDPFFDDQPPGSDARGGLADATAPREQRSETDAFFEQLASQSATEMAHGLRANPEQNDSPPGSAALAPSDATTVRARRPRTSVRRHRLGGRVSAMSLTISTSVALLVTAAVVLVLVTRGTSLASPGHTADQPVTSALNLDNPLTPLGSTTRNTSQPRLTDKHNARTRSRSGEKRTRQGQRSRRRSGSAGS
ncbi:MAG: hypothetical protein ACYC0H_21855, partial [Solirubrobacteraceae bacterium]